MKFFMLMLLLCNWAPAQDLEKATDVARMISTLPPSKVSKYILGFSDGIYPNTAFWSQLGLKNIIQIQSKMIAKDRIALMTVTYSSSDQVTIASLKVVSLLLVTQGQNWKVLPDEFLDIYLDQGSERAAVAVKDREQIIPPDLKDFDQAIADSISIREGQEKEQREHMLRVLQEKGIPVDRVTEPPDLGN